MLFLDTEYAPWGGEKPQGRIQFSVFEDHIIRYNVSGPICRDLILCFAEIHATAIQKIKKNEQAWTALVVFRSVGDVDPEAIGDLARYMQKVRSIGLLSHCAAMVFPSLIAVPKETRNSFADAFRNADVAIKDFNRESEALEWLRGLRMS